MPVLLSSYLENFKSPVSLIVPKGEISQDLGSCSQSRYWFSEHAFQNYALVSDAHSRKLSYTETCAGTATDCGCAIYQFILSSQIPLFCFVLLGLCPPDISFCLLAQYPDYQERTLKGCCRRKELLILVLVCVLFSCFCSGGWGAAAPPGRVLPSKCTGPPANFPVSLQATFQQGS